MQIETQRVTRTTFTARQRLDLPMPQTDRERGVVYQGDLDERAFAVARPFFDRAVDAIRRQAKSSDLPIALAIHRDGDALYAVASGTLVGRS